MVLGIKESPGFDWRLAMFCCLECGKKFKSVRAAEKASYDGCPKCGGVDIDLDVKRPSGPLPEVIAKGLGGVGGSLGVRIPRIG